MRFGNCSFQWHALQHLSAQLYVCLYVLFFWTYWFLCDDSVCGLQFLPSGHILAEHAPYVEENQTSVERRGLCFFCCNYEKRNGGWMITYLFLLQMIRLNRGRWKFCKKTWQGGKELEICNCRLNFLWEIPSQEEIDWQVNKSQKAEPFYDS